jgi:hypothetical protein
LGTRKTEKKDRKGSVFCTSARQSLLRQNAESVEGTTASESVEAGIEGGVCSKSDTTASGRPCAHTK